MLYTSGAYTRTSADPVFNRTVKELFAKNCHREALELAMLLTLAKSDSERLYLMQGFMGEVTMGSVGLETRQRQLLSWNV